MLELAQGFCLDLTDPFAGHTELLTDFLQRVVGVHADAKAHPQNAFLTRSKRGQNPRCRLLQVLLNSRIQRQNGVLILDEVAKLAVFLVADGRLKADRLFGDFACALAWLLSRLWRAYMLRGRA